MSKYYTLVAGLRELAFEGKVDAVAVRDEHPQGVSPRDRVYVDMLLGGDLDSAGKSPNKFLREWAAFDRDVRGTVAALVARRLGVMYDGAPTNEAVRAIMAGGDVLERERALDRLRWRTADELTVFDYFDIDNLLAYLVKVGILERWAALDAERGREVLGKLVMGQTDAELCAREPQRGGTPTE
jgi:hypothetical protein